MMNQTMQVMGILNVTADSFSDGGRYLNPGRAVERALQMIEEGADYIDIGGESTRPGARQVSAQQELDRVLPVIELLAKHSDIIISVDTSKPAVMAAAVQAGAKMINDVRALQAPEALAAAAAAKVPVCLMHMSGEPDTMQRDPQYVNVVDEIIEFLQARVNAALSAGVSAEHIIIDPGFGFGKTIQHNLQIVAQLDKLQKKLGYPILLGVSRKSTLGALTGKAVTDRLAGSLAMVACALQHHVAIMRVHDVEPTVDFIKVYNAVDRVGNVL
jgi:dihydropteroate synthase